MPEIGLVQMANTALQVAQAVLPERRSRFSTNRFAQLQLLALLCVMRFEDWTHRETEVRVAEHQELRRPLGLERVPDHTTIYRFSAIKHKLSGRAPGRTLLTQLLQAQLLVLTFNLYRL